MKRLEQLWNKNLLGKIVALPLSQIRPNPYQPRRQFDEIELKELAKSIQTYGVIQPIIVRKNEDYYEIVAGERRYRACRLIGNKEMPAIVQEMDDEKVASIALIENLQRKDLNYFEEAIAYYILLKQFDLTQEEVAYKVGKSQSAIANKLRLLKLPLEVRERIMVDRISERHARALLKVDNIEAQLFVLRQIYERELNVRETEDLIAGILTNSIPSEKKTPEHGKQVSIIIRDARIFLNTIKETVKRAKKTGIDMTINEQDNEDFYEISISIPKSKSKNKVINI
jgi:ParB family chromosome partitioning protein